MSLFNLSSWHKHGFFYCEGKEILQYRMGFNITIVLPVPEIVDWHTIWKGQNPANSLFLCSSFVCSLSCLEGTLWSPGKEPCWIFSWIIKDVFKGKSLQQLQEYSGSTASLGPKRPLVNLLLARIPGPSWMPCAVGQNEIHCLAPRQNCQLAEHKNSVHHESCCRTRSISSGTSCFCMKGK